MAEISELLAKLHGLDKDNCTEIRWSTAMHDVGKVTIPAPILHKPAQLAIDEFDVIKTHTSIGYDILKRSSKPFLKSAAIIADVFDALLQKRSYKKSWSIDEVTEYLISLRGIAFEPDLLDLFLENI